MTLFQRHGVEKNGVHLNITYKRRKRGTQGETKVPKRISRSLKAKTNAQKFKLDKGHGTLGDMATRRPACQGTAEDIVCQELKGMPRGGRRQLLGRREGGTLWSG